METAKYSKLSIRIKLFGKLSFEENSCLSNDRNALIKTLILMFCILVQNVQNVNFMILRQKVHIFHDVYQLPQFFTINSRKPQINVREPRFN